MNRLIWGLIVAAKASRYRSYRPVFPEEVQAVIAKKGLVIYLAERFNAKERLNVRCVHRQDTDASPTNIFVLFNIESLVSITLHLKF